MKIKTLKDLEKEPYFYSGTEAGDKIRQEAIKHYKNLMNVEELMKWTLLDWIKYFFNITSEDLKNG